MKKLRRNRESDWIIAGVCALWLFRLLPWLVTGVFMYLYWIK